LENQYNLHGYGIPVDQLPVTDTGNVKTKNLLQWIKVRKAWESSNRFLISEDPLESSSSTSSSSSSTIECPGMNDVVFRSGQACLSHPGNVMFRGLIEAKYPEHTQSSSSEVKVAITWWIMDQVEQRNGRFLTWDNGWWKQVVDRQQIRCKIASAFKDQKRRLKALSNCQMTHSSTYKFERQDGKKRKRPNGSETGSFCGDQGLY
jgi:hypothetical protein